MIEGDDFVANVDNFDLSTNEGRINAAIAEINRKKSDLEAAAREVAKAFTDLTTTVQLQWLNTLIRNEWNNGGNLTVNNAINALTNLMNDLNETAETARNISSDRAA